MIITIGAEGANLNDAVAKRFGHANYYIIYNTNDNTFEAVKNEDEDHTHSNLYELIDKGTEVFIVGNIGPYAFEIINENRDVYLARKMTVQEAINKFKKGELKKLTKPTAKNSIGEGRHNHEHGHGEGHRHGYMHRHGE